MTSDGPPAGWYADPWKPDGVRWWNGAQWTATFAPGVAVVSAEPAGLAVPVERVAAARRPVEVPPSLAQMVRQLRPSPISYDLDEQIEVAGETYHIKGIKAVYRQAGMPITPKGSTVEQVQCALLPEPWNEHDTNAVAVMIGMHHVGYVPAEDAVFYSRPLGLLAGKGDMITGTARIWAKDDGGVIRARVTILVPSAESLGG